MCPMKSFYAQTELLSKLPDDRLYNVAEEPGGAVVQYRRGHICEGYARDVGEMIRHLVRAGIFILDDDGVITYTGGTQRWADHQPPVMGPYEIVMERADEERLHGQPFGLRLRRDSMVWVVEKHLVTPELVREHNLFTEGRFRCRVWKRPSLL